MGLCFSWQAGLRDVNLPNTSFASSPKNIHALPNNGSLFHSPISIRVFICLINFLKNRFAFKNPLLCEGILPPGLIGPVLNGIAFDDFLD